MRNNSDIKMTSGYMMMIIGFVFILITALNYIFGWKYSTIPGGIAIVFLGAGAARIRKSREQQNKL
jgi:hypothetical protein